MSKWNKWKLIHKETGLTFKQQYQKFGIKTSTGYVYSVNKNYNLIPVLLQSGILAVYVDQGYYPSMFFLNNKDWELTIKLAPSNIPKKPNIVNSGSGKIHEV